MIYAKQTEYVSHLTDMYIEDSDTKQNFALHYAL